MTIDSYESKLKKLMPLCEQYKAIEELDKVIETLENYDSLKLDFITDSQRRRAVADLMAAAARTKRSELVVGLARVYPKELF